MSVLFFKYATVFRLIWILLSFYFILNRCAFIESKPLSSFYRLLSGLGFFFLFRNFHFIAFPFVVLFCCLLWADDWSRNREFYIRAEMRSHFDETPELMTTDFLVRNVVEWRIWFCFMFSIVSIHSFDAADNQKFPLQGSYQGSEWVSWWWLSTLQDQGKRIHYRKVGTCFE